MFSAYVVLVSIRAVCTVWSYACVSVVFIVCWMWCGSRRVSAFEFATMYMFMLYFLGWVPVVVYVCGSVTIFLIYLACRFRAR
jgi:hypothetical protein